ncbi:MAG: hypothetical protein FJX93_04495 [Bacteroidetes bacterium]|nr:hypothetical protein [Bacteroidota bacterium]
MPQAPNLVVPALTLQEKGWAPYPNAAQRLLRGLLRWGKGFARKESSRLELLVLGHTRVPIVGCGGDL